MAGGPRRPGLGGPVPFRGLAGDGPIVAPAPAAGPPGPWGPGRQKASSAARPGGQAVALRRHGAVSPRTDMATLSPFCRAPGRHVLKHGRPVAAWATGRVGRGVPRSRPVPPSRPAASWQASRCLPLVNSLMEPCMGQQLGDGGLGSPSGASCPWPSRGLGLGWTTGRWPHQDDPWDPRPGRPGGDVGHLGDCRGHGVGRVGAG
jgi:hypothetical protein